MGKKNGPSKNDRHLYALQDFLNGMTVPQIARKYGVKLRTAQGWHERHSWATKRREAMAQAQATIYNKLQQKVADSTERYLEMSKIGAQLGLMRVTAIYKGLGKAPKPDQLDAQYDTLKKWATLANEFVKVQKYAMPQASEELSRLILEELKRIGRSGLLDED